MQNRSSRTSPSDPPLFTPHLPEDAMWMQRALEYAHAAATIEEVPVGAVIVHERRLVAGAYNLTRTCNDPTAHAEMVALRRAAERLGSARLLDATMYVTLEPCSMCAGALVLAKVRRLVYAAADPKTGMCGSLGCIVQDPRLNHRMELATGVLEGPAGELLRRFFRARRRSAGDPATSARTGAADVAPAERAG